MIRRGDHRLQEISFALARRVFVLWRNPLFRDSVRLLLQHPDIELVGIAPEYAAAVPDIVSTRPDTILAEEVEGHLPAGVLESLEDEAQALRVVGLSIEDNLLRIFRREQSELVNSEDLLRLVLE